ncbi:replication protein [Methylovulum psychrotolerans]|jgi:hypothetical protein|uniref:Replication protein n=2 Tax=Methylovulum psychrotolerans TaxID=1704499 RepID=A0A2S5CI19_9GAMM|nr:replication protein [Methylovulum psychrotolerans]
MSSDSRKKMPKNLPTQKETSRTPPEKPGKSSKKSMVLLKEKGDINLPSSNAFKSDQLDLFQTFLCNTHDEKDKLSNTIELWDSLPKFAISQQAMNGLRTKEGFLPRLEKTFVYRHKEYKIRVTPAIIDSEDDIDKAYYPSANEELVEDALRKIASEQQRGFFDKPEFKSGVVFSLHLLRTELKKRGHSRSYYEIVKSLNILSGSHIEILLPDGKGFAKTNYLPSLAAVSKEQIKDDPTAKWVAHFHPLVTQSIDSLSFRQFNYHQMMSHSTQLARWIHKKLSHNYTNASYTVPYQIWLSTIRRDSGLLEYKRTNDAVRKFEDALAELINNHALTAFSKLEDIRGEKNKILDIKYSLSPHPEFVKDVKAANKRQKDSKDKTEQQGQ